MSNVSKKNINVYVLFTFYIPILYSGVFVHATLIINTDSAGPSTDWQILHKFDSSPFKKLTHVLNIK